MHNRTKFQTRLLDLLGWDEVAASLSRLLPYMKRYRLVYAGLVFFLLYDVGSKLFFAWFLKSIADGIVTHRFGQVWSVFVVGVGVTLIGIAIQFADTYWQSRLVSLVTRDLREDVFRHMMKLPFSFFADSHSGDLVSRLTNNINGIGGAAVGQMLNLIRLPLTALGAFAYLAVLNGPLALACLLISPVSLMIGTLFGLRMRKINQKIQEQLGAMHSFLNDTLLGQKIIRSFNMERRMSHTFSNHNDELLDLYKKDAKLVSYLGTGVSAVGSVAYLLCVGFGAWLAGGGRITFGELLAFVTLFQYILQPMTGMAFAWGSLQRSMATMDRIAGILDRTEELRQLPEPAVSDPVRSGIQIRNLAFAYQPGRYIFRNFSLFIPAGKVTAIVGPSGAGKSTLFHLLLGLYKPDGGAILIDGFDPAEKDPSAIRNYMSLVPQETLLFSGSIRDNIAFGRPGATDEEIMHAASFANAHSFITEQPSGYDTEIGERGVRLSGGQCQRIAIARALLRDAPVLLLDEATSALDQESEFAVKQAIERLMKSRTTIVIAHRLSTIQHADQIIVLKEGAIAEQGDHESLLAQKGFYYQLFHQKFGQTKVG